MLSSGSVVDRFFHQNLTGPEAEQRMLSVSAKPGTFLVRPSKSQADYFVLSIVVMEKKVKILHVKITYQVRHARMCGCREARRSSVYVSSFIADSINAAGNAIASVCSSSVR